MLLQLLVFLVAAVGTLALIQYLQSNESHSSYQPKFHANQCFNRSGIREPWETNGPDGIIIMKGYESYLVMFRSEAERRSGGVKLGLPFPMQSFDESHYEVQCPKEWINHTRRKS
jgi:hypothetical protein